MIRAVVSIAVLVIGGAIVADLVSHPTGTSGIVNGLTSLWTTAVKGASGSYAVAGK
jgi:hypothetical protein